MVRFDKKETICFKILKEKKWDLKLHNSNLIISKLENIQGFIRTDSDTQCFAQVIQYDTCEKVLLLDLTHSKATRFGFFTSIV